MAPDSTVTIRHSASPGRNLRHSCILAFFLLSGISGLVYEVIWTRKLSLIFGSTTVAVSISLAVYLGGLALGAYLWGRRADRMRRPFLVYGMLEMGVGAYGALSYFCLSAIEPVYLYFQKILPLAGAFSHSPQMVLVAVVLLPPTILMGGTLPVLIRADFKEGTNLGARVGLLYAVNTAGAVLGSMFSGFALLPQLGLIHSLFAAAALNLAVGFLVVIWSVGFGTWDFKPRGGPDFSDSALIRSGAIGSEQSLVFEAIVFFSGFCTLFYEVVWTRALSLVLGNSTQAFSLMLTVFLLGLTLGTAFSGWMVRRGWNSTIHLALVQGLIGLSIFVAVWVIRLLPTWFLFFYKDYSAEPLLFLACRAFLSASVLLMPAIMMGIVFPLCIACKKGDPRHEADLVGRFYAVNVAGAIAGSLSAGLILIESLGMHRCMLLGMWLNLSFSAWIMFRNKKRVLHLRPVWSLIPVSLGVLLTFLAPMWDPVAMTRGVYFYAQQILDTGIDNYLAQDGDRRLLFYREGTAGTVTVQEFGNKRTLYIDGRAEGGYTAAAQILLGHLPFAFSRSVQDVAIVGLGTGNTVGTVTLYAVRHVDVFELEPTVIQASAYFDAINHTPLKDSRVRVQVLDARNALSLKPEGFYDLIISQPSNPWVSGSSKLFTNEFYRLSRSRLREGGIFAQWVQLSGMRFDSVASLLNTFKTNFLNVYVFEVGARSGEIILIGSKDELVLSWPTLKHIYNDPVRARELARVLAPDPGALLARLILGPDELSGLFEGHPLNTDDNGLFEFASFASMYEKTSEENLKRLRSLSGNTWRYISGQPEGAERQKLLMQMADASLRGMDFTKALNHAEEVVRLGNNPDSLLLLGDALYVNQRKQEAVNVWRKTLALKPNYTPALRRLIRHYGTIENTGRPPEYNRWLTRIRN